MASGTENGDAVLELRGLQHRLTNRRTGESFTLEIPELTIGRGRFVSILGSTGCGKTTLLTILGLAAKPNGFDEDDSQFSMSLIGDRGKERIDMIEAWNGDQSNKIIGDIRKQHLGFCLQRGELIPNLTVYENVELPLRLGKTPRSEFKDRIEEVLASVGVDSDELWTRRNHLPVELSGGQYQRVAVARALVHRPDILFVDEPTSNLDQKTAVKTLDILKNVKSDCTIIMITHDRQLATEYSEFMVEMHSAEEGVGTIDRIRSKRDGEWDEGVRIENGPEGEGGKDKGKNKVKEKEKGKATA